MQELVQGQGVSTCRWAMALNLWGLLLLRDPPQLSWNRKVPSFHGRPRGGTEGSLDDGEAMHWQGEAYAELLPFMQGASQRWQL